MIRVVPPGSGSRLFTHPAPRGQKDTGSRIRILNTDPDQAQSRVSPKVGERYLPESRWSRGSSRSGMCVGGWCCPSPAGPPVSGPGLSPRRAGPRTEPTRCSSRSRSSPASPFLQRDFNDWHKAQGGASDLVIIYGPVQNFPQWIFFF